MRATAVNLGQLGGGTVQIGDPSGRTTARSRQGADVQSMNVESIQRQLETLWTNVKCLGIKHQYSQVISRKREILNNKKWLEKLSAVEMMRDLGSGMRLGAMLSRDSYVLQAQYKSAPNICVELSYEWRVAKAWRSPNSAIPSSKPMTGGACTETRACSYKSAAQISTAT
jgi:tyrosyl-tRNA synthetase